jgi:hypothetical protein
MPVNGVRVTSADFHELVAATARQLGDLRNKGTRSRGIPVLIDKSHEVPPLSSDSHKPSRVVCL